MKNPERDFRDIILAVDTGLATCGWAVVGKHGRVIALGLLGTEADDELGVQHGRVVRAGELAEQIAAIAAEHNVGAIAGEALSFPPMGRVAAVASVCLSWGVLAGIASVFGIRAVDVAPKLWQAGVLGRTGKVDYAVVELALHEYVEAQGGQALEQLLAIPKGQRTHPLDAVGVGVYASMNGLAIRTDLVQPAHRSTHARRVTKAR